MLDQLSENVTSTADMTCCMRKLGSVFLCIKSRACTRSRMSVNSSVKARLSPVVRNSCFSSARTECAECGKMLYLFGMHVLALIHGQHSSLKSVDHVLVYLVYYTMLNAVEHTDCVNLNHDRSCECSCGAALRLRSPACLDSASTSCWSPARAPQAPPQAPARATPQTSS